MHPQILFAHSSLKWTTKTCSAPPVFTKLHPSYHLNSTQPDHAMWQSPPLKINQSDSATSSSSSPKTLTLIFSSPSTLHTAAAANLFRPPSQLRANLHREHTATSLTHQPWKLPHLRSPHLREPEHRDAAPPFSLHHLLRRAHHDNTIFMPPRGLLRDHHDSAAHNHGAPSPAPVPPPSRSSSSLAPPDRAVTTCSAAPFLPPHRCSNNSTIAAHLHLLHGSSDREANWRTTAQQQRRLLASVPQQHYRSSREPVPPLHLQPPRPPEKPPRRRSSFHTNLALLCSQRSKRKP